MLWSDVIEGEQGDGAWHRLNAAQSRMGLAIRARHCAPVEWSDTQDRVPRRRAHRRGVKAVHPVRGLRYKDLGAH